jgi:hypothetical protein
LPFPLYLLHGWQEKKNAIDIHLMDGGQHENLAAVSLIRRRIPNIIISDHSTEMPWGGMEDICNLKKQLLRYSFTGDNKVWHIHIDQLSDLEKVCQSKKKLRYDLLQWKNPVLKGCAVELDSDKYFVSDKEKEVVQLRDMFRGKDCGYWKEQQSFAQAGKRNLLNLFVLKPALNLDEWRVKFNCLSKKKLKRNIASCLSIETDPDQLAGDIEILGFIGNSNDGFRDANEKDRFPLHDTIKLTIDSSPFLFGAYRELAARAASNLKIDEKGNLQTNAILEEQSIKNH